MMNIKWKRKLKWLMLLALPIGLGLIVREQRSWMPQVICESRGVEYIQISPDGNFLMLRQYRQSDLKLSGMRLIDVRTRVQRNVAVTEEKSGAACFSPDSQQIVQGCLTAKGFNL